MPTFATTTYYGQAKNADLRVSSITGADHDYAHVRAEQAVRLRLWSQFVSQFWKDNETRIRAGNGKASVSNFGKMTRKEALKAIDKFLGGHRVRTPIRRKDSDYWKV
jgi:hypothetical protein